MRSLSLKLTLAFLLVGITGVLLVSLFVGLRTRREFDQFVLDRFQTDMVAALQRYYEENRSWQGLDRVSIHMPYGPREMPFERAPVVVANADSIVVHGNRHMHVGARLSPQNMAQAVPIRAGGRIVGWALFKGPLQPPAATSPEAVFLNRIRLAIALAAIAASLLALLLGALLARSITKPVKTLTAATKRVAQGELGLQVQVKSHDELGELAASFNHMSSDLAEASRLRKQMTADIAHDLRTPLTVILGYAEALADGKMAGDSEIFTAIHEEAQHLQRLVEDLRLLSLADAGELALHRQPVAPVQMLQRLQRARQLQARQRGIRLQIEADPDLPTIFIDPERMMQALYNLIDNALRHTPAGGQVRLCARSREGRVQLMVADTGSGIAAEDLPHIFERHYRSDKARARDDGSSGLGLAIVKAIVELHGGTIEVASILGEGTTFTITLAALSK